MKEILKLVDVTKFYNTAGTVAMGLRHINLTFAQGEFVAITGESGCGKTTLLNVLSGLDKYEEGEMFICGQETSFYTETERERYRAGFISFIFQDYNIIDSYTVFQNVELALFDRYPDRAERHSVVNAIIARVGLTAHAKHRGTKLSGGQKQRVAIARALAKDAPILFADEPTGNLDSRTGQEILALLNELSAEKLVVVVTHNYEDLEQYATRRIRLYDGEVVEDKQMTASDGASAIAAGRRAANDLDTPQNGYYTLPSASTTQSASTQTVDIPTEHAQKSIGAMFSRERMHAAKQKLSQLFTISKYNLRSTPKMSFFMFTGMVLLAMSIMYTFFTYRNSNIEMEYDTRFGKGEMTAVDEIQLYSETGITDAKISEIRAVNGVKCVTYFSDEALGWYMIGTAQINSDKLSYGDYDVSYRDTNDVRTQRYFDFDCLDCLSDPVVQGRLPTADGEVLLLISRGETVNLLVDSDVTFEFSSFDTDATPRTMRVVGYGYSDEASISSCLAYVTHPQYMALQSYATADPRVTESGVPTNVYVTFDEAHHSYRSLAPVFRDMGYRTYYPYGLQANSVGLEYFVAFVLFGVIFVLMYVVMAIIGNNLKKVASVKNRDYNIMHTVGISHRMTGSMLYSEVGILSSIAYVVGSILLFFIYLGTLIAQKAQKTLSTPIPQALSQFLTKDFVPAVLVGIPVMILFTAYIIYSFNKKQRALTVRSAMSEV